MSGAMGAVQAAVAEALRNSAPVMAAVSGVYDGPPSRAAFPYIALSDGSGSDWSTKTAPGREIGLVPTGIPAHALTVWDDGEEPARLYGLMHDVDAAVSGIERDLDGWRVASVAFVRSLVVRDPAGPWAGLVEHRVRVMATD
jgi:hypothetical protein